MKCQCRKVLFWDLFFYLRFRLNQKTSVLTDACFVVLLQVPAVSTLWFRMWPLHRAGRPTWPAVWSTMTTPPSSGQTRHSKPSSSGTRKVSGRLSNSCLRKTDTVFKSVSCAVAGGLESCLRGVKKKRKITPHVHLSDQHAAFFFVVS